jgi:hypothetical protein
LIQALTALLALVTLVPAVAPAQELPPGGTFRDDDGNIHEGNIEAIAAAGITLGCDTELYCPADTVTRGQMAAFINRAVDLPASPTDHFTDDDGSTFESDINRLAEAGITLGCSDGATSYCPNGLVTRGQMAAFLVRAYGYEAGAGSNRFDDDNGSTFESDIERLAEAGVTTGCSAADPRLYCPSDHIRRDQMATFLARAEGLDPIIPPVRCSIFPADNIWNRRVDDLPVHARSDAYVASIGSSTTLHPDFGSGVWPPASNSPIGIPYVEVDGTQPLVPITWNAYGSESDDGPYPTPLDAPIEGGPDATGDRHVLTLDTDNCVLYELYSAYPTGSGWDAASGAVYDLRSNDLRPDGWTSADAAGLPILPGLVRYDEVAAGSIDHPIRFTASDTQQAYVWPARHFASSITDLNVPPMGQRFRMRSDFDISGFSSEIHVILTAFKEYGLILADNGSDWFISGAPDERWDNDMLRELKDIPGSAFEAVDVSGLIVDPDSGQVSG